ncbi:MAG: DNA primase [Solirubrobacterales bacterium]|nr:DNA primase [Solirubrobacterales bacterium]
MARYTADSKERVRDAVDMVALVSVRSELRRAGPSSYQGLCPFHEERSPSFGIDPAKKVYYCFGCGASGDVFTYAMETEGLDFVAAMEWLADRFSITLEVEAEDEGAAERRKGRERLLELLDRTATFYSRFLWDSSEAADARTYLAGRGLTQETLQTFRVGYAPSAWDTVLLASRRNGFSELELVAAGLASRNKERGSAYDRFRGRIMFPLADLRGRTLGFGARAMRDSQQPKYLNSSDGEVYHKGRQLFAADLARAASAKAGRTVLVEGYTDVLALHQAGLHNTVGLMGTALTSEQAGALARLAPIVDLALDADAAGKDAMLRAARVAAGQRLELRVVAMPAGTDPAELVASEGAEAVRARVEAAVPFASFQVQRILETANLSNGEGRDIAYNDLRNVLSGVPPSPSRDDLVRLVAGRLTLSEQLVSLLVAPPTDPRPTPTSDSQAANKLPPRAAVVLDRRQQTERNFLALCIALPEAGRDALRSVDLDQHFTSELTRRGAAHLREHLTDPADHVAPDDTEMTGLIAELSVRGSRELASPDTLAVELLQLEMARIEREIASARSSGRLDIATLAAELNTVKAEFGDAVERATSTRAGQ